MKIGEQIKYGALAPYYAFKQLRASSIWPLAIYFGCALLIFSLFSWLLIRYQADIKQLIFDYLLPKSWHGISDYLVDFFFESQTKLVLANLIINGGIVVASLFLLSLIHI